MVCIYCSNSTDVTNSRRQKRTNSVWRRRHCHDCGAVFTTSEQPDLTHSLIVELPDGKLVPFSRDSLFATLWESCKHRETALEDATSLTATVISQLLRSQARAGLITRNQIVQTAFELLEQFDRVAATMYAAYHPAFKTKTST